MSTYQELLINEYAKQYATHWFKIDEDSGNILNDSKGNVVGTINGASWVDGGGLLFDNISNYVDFNSQVIPFGEKSIYFKFKSDEINPPQTAFLFSNINTNTSSKNGYVIGIFNGTPVVLFYQNSNSFSKWIGFSSQENVLTKGKIHEILVVCDSDLNFTFYIDDFTTPTRVNIPLGYTESKFDINGRLGRSNHNDTTYAQQFKGTIYDFKVWNQDITKLNINKTLILHDGKYKKFNKTKEYLNEIYLLNMTSDTSPSPYKVSASSVFSSTYPAWKAFNGVTELTSDNERWLSGDGVPQHISIDFGEKRKVNYLHIYHVENGSSRVENFSIQGSNDGSNWVTLKTIIGESWDGYSNKKFFLDEVVEYQHYRLYITKLKSGSTRVSIVELVYGAEQEYSPSNWEAVSNTKPTLTQFVEDGMGDLSILDRQVNELPPMQMEDKTSILFTNGEVGKVYQKSLDLQKYLDIRSIKVEVK